MEKVAKLDVPDQFLNFLTHPLNHPVTVTKNKPLLRSIMVTVITGCKPLFFLKQNRDPNG